MSIGIAVARDHTEAVHASESSRSPLVVLTTIWATLLPLTGFRLADIITPADLLLAITAVLWLIATALTELSAFARLLSFLLLIGLTFTLTALSSGLYARDVPESTGRAIQLMLSVACVTVVVWGAARKGTSSVHRLMLGYVLGCCVLVISSWTLPNIAGHRFIGLAVHPVEVGGTLSVGIAYLAFCHVRSRIGITAKISGLTLLGSGFLRAETLTGPVTTALAVVLAAALQPTFRPLRGIAFVTSVLVGGWLFISTAAGEQLYRKFLDAMSIGHLFSGRFNKESSLDSRLQSMVYGMKRIADHPLSGNGLDSSGMAAVSGLEPHNVLILAWQSGGLVLFLFFGGMFVATVLLMIMVRRAETDELFIKPLAAAAVASWIASFSGPQLEQRTWLLPIMAFILVAMHVRRETRVKKSAES